MVVYREFCTKEKTMQERMREIVLRVLENSRNCNLESNNVKLNHLGIKDSVFN